MRHPPRRWCHGGDPHGSRLARPAPALERHRRDIGLRRAGHAPAPEDPPRRAAHHGPRPLSRPRREALTPVLVADTLWVSWALHSTGAAGQEVFLLYSFVFFLAMLGESLPVMLLGSGFLCAASFIFVPPAAMWTSAHLLRVVFLYVGTLF